MQFLLNYSRAIKPQTKNVGRLIMSRLQIVTCWHIQYYLRSISMYQLLLVLEAPNRRFPSSSTYYKNLYSFLSSLSLLFTHHKDQSDNQIIRVPCPTATPWVVILCAIICNVSIRYLRSNKMSTNAFTPKESSHITQRLKLTPTWRSSPQKCSCVLIVQKIAECLFCRLSGRFRFYLKLF